MAAMFNHQTNLGLAAALHEVGKDEKAAEFAAADAMGKVNNV